MKRYVINYMYNAFGTTKRNEVMVCANTAQEAIKYFLLTTKVSVDKNLMLIREVNT